MKREFKEEEIDRIIEMAWEDKTPLAAIPSINQSIKFKS